MTNITPIVKSYAAPPFDRREILRYLGCKSDSDGMDELLDSGLALCSGKLRYDTVSAVFPVRIDGNSVDLGFAHVTSRDLAKCLDGCDYAAVFAATLGLDMDRLISRYSKVETSMSLCLQAIGAERIEALCDAFCNDLEAQVQGAGNILRPRFSAGYGDLSLSVQESIFEALACRKNIGLTLNQSLLMSPSKSVTAIVGIKKTRI